MNVIAEQLPVNRFDSAMGVLLSYFNVKPSDVQSVGDTTEQRLDSMLHPHGIMRRKVRLEGHGIKMPSARCWAPCKTEPPWRSCHAV